MHDDIENLLGSLTGEDLEELAALLEIEAGPQISFLEYFMTTVSFKPDPWQLDLITRLDEASRGQAKRILIHAPPQIGKSTIMQRFAAWLILNNPLRRVKYACYNLDRSKAHSKVIRELLHDNATKRMFPNCKVPKLMPAEGWQTIQRIQRNDAQMTFQPLGLITGFTGQGVDDLIIDDPYASAADAYSESYNEMIRIFWEETARPRIIEANVYVMFHRYSDRDFIAMLLEEGEWEEWRYPAICEEHPDILNRQLGETLSPRFDKDYFDRQRAYSESTFAAQFQGRPVPLGGGIIKKDWFHIIDSKDAPGFRKMFERTDEPRLKHMVIGVDLAVTEKTSADYTVALPVAVTDEKIPNIYVFRPFRGQVEWPQARVSINEIANAHGCRTLAAEGRGGQTGLVQDLSFYSKKNVIKVVPINDKEARARLWLPVVEQGRVFLVEDGSGWTQKFLDECAAFPRGRNDDQVDAFGAALSVLGNGNYGAKMEITNAYAISRI